MSIVIFCFSYLLLVKSGGQEREGSVCGARTGGQNVRLGDLIVVICHQSSRTDNHAPMY